MSANEIISSFGIQASPEVVAELDEHLAAADEVHALAVHPHGHAPAASTKLGLVGAGGRILAKFSPGPSGSGECPKSGTGGFVGSQSASGLSGNYKLEVGRITVKLLHGTRVVWSGTGLQKGLSGTWDVKF